MKVKNEEAFRYMTNVELTYNNKAIEILEKTLAIAKLSRMIYGVNIYKMDIGGKEMYMIYATKTADNDDNIVVTDLCAESFPTLKGAKGYCRKKGLEIKEIKV